MEREKLDQLILHGTDDEVREVIRKLEGQVEALREELDFLKPLKIEFEEAKNLFPPPDTKLAVCSGLHGHLKAIADVILPDGPRGEYKPMVAEIKKRWNAMMEERDGWKWKVERRENELEKANASNQLLRDRPDIHYQILDSLLVHGEALVYDGEVLDPSKVVIHREKKEPFAKGGVLKDPGVTFVGEKAPCEIIPLTGKVESVPGTPIQETPEQKEFREKIATEVTGAVVQDVMDASYEPEYAEVPGAEPCKHEWVGGEFEDGWVRERCRRCPAERQYPSGSEPYEPERVEIPVKFPSGTARMSEGEEVTCVICGTKFYTKLIITVDAVRGPICDTCWEKEFGDGEVQEVPEPPRDGS